jgi:site-specific recombinase
VATAVGVNEPAASATVGLDWVVTGARADAPLAERLEWVEHLFTWIRAHSGESAPATRLKFLLQVLERNPDHKRAVGTTLRATFRELSALALLCETGLPRSNAFLQEFGARLAAKVLPAPPAAADFATVFRRVFPDEADADWIAALPAAQLDGLGDLLREGIESGATDPWLGLRRDAEDALLSACRAACAAEWRRAAPSTRPLPA